ncbi:MAG: hypothetical protein ACEPO8_10720, partial [Rhodothermaceae bacterium]
MNMTKTMMQKAKLLLTILLLSLTILSCSDEQSNIVEPEVSGKTTEMALQKANNFQPLISEYGKKLIEGNFDINKLSEYRS